MLLEHVYSSLKLTQGEKICVLGSTHIRLPPIKSIEKETDFIGEDVYGTKDTDLLTIFT